MREIDESNAAQYLMETGRLSAEAPVRALSGGVSNVVLAVDADPPFVLKQSRPQLRTVDPWFSDVSRVHREVDAMRALQPVLGSNIPAVLFEDRDNYLFGMSAAPADAVTWKQVLLSGVAEPRRAELAGRILGALHDMGSREPQWRQPFADAANFHELRLEPYYLRLRSRFSDLATAMDPLIERAQSTKLSLVHADFSPKNILVTDDSFLLVDYETVHFGDPAFDLGFFLAHLTLKSIHHEDRRAPYIALIETFWDSYLREVKTLDAADLVRWGLQHLAANILVRIDGTSPVDYLANETHRRAGRRYARRLFEAKPATPAQAVELLTNTLHQTGASAD